MSKKIEIVPRDDVKYYFADFVLKVFFAHKKHQFFGQKSYRFRGYPPLQTTFSVTKSAK